MSCIAVPTHQPDNVYNHRWFRKLVLLIYCLSLSVAAEILYAFLIKGAITEIGLAAPVLLRPFAEWFGLNAGIVWIFAAIGVSAIEGDPMPQFEATSLMRRKFSAFIDRFKGRVGSNVWAWITAIAWNGIVFVLMAGSALSGYYIFYFNFPGVW